MKLTTSRLVDLAASPKIIVIGGISSIGSVLWLLFAQINDTFHPFQAFIVVLSLAILVIGYVYSIAVRVENISLRRLPFYYYEINHLYKNTLLEMFGEQENTKDSDTLIKYEKDILSSVCQRISDIFSSLINRKCMATIKLVTIEDEAVYARTYVRSHSHSERDFKNKTKFSVGNGKNTSFDEALRSRNDGLPQHFYSPDLTIKGSYHNERVGFSNFYKSTLVVPIGGHYCEDKESNQELFYDLIGFLCVDTMSTNRLNDNDHLYMLSALAEQMYNFISLMRGKYSTAEEAK